MSVEIIFEFHSTSLDNEAAVASGWSDPPLSAKGRAEARELGERRQGEQIDAIFCSDLRRAVETAEIAFGKRIPIHADLRLCEYDYGTMTGTPVERIHADRPARVDSPFPDGESLRDVAKRVGDFLDDVRRLGWQTSDRCRARRLEAGARSPAGRNDARRCRESSIHLAAGAP